ncbi:MAG: aminotransferase class I/II-fold pyridoxal phosphate-dependent enzyme [Deinococcus sp.]|nr:aminotransferase class I/II-fold pyridoxal phosphate-dependent enzyme [Deinococcus sp.]
MSQRKLKPATIAAHAGSVKPQSGTVPEVEPIYQASVYRFADLDTVDAVQEGRAEGYVYGRYGLPNHASLEQVVAALEGAEGAVVTASGMGCILVTLLAFARSGDQLVASRDLYGGTLALLTQDLAQLGIEVRFVDDVQQVEQAITSRTKLLLVETITNPLVRVTDLRRWVDLARRHQLPLVVDNTFATPLLCRPRELGASVVLHSLTKFLGGHSDLLGGVTCGNTQFVKRARTLSIHLGTNLSPFDAWLAARGIKTLGVRFRAANSNAQTIAEFLAQHPKVTKVYYPGLPTSPDHALASELFSGGYGNMLAFEMQGGLAGLKRLLKGLDLIGLVPSLGGVRTTCSHPAKTSHRSLSAAERQRLGISDGLLRLSVGIEDAADLLSELEQALEQV